MNFSEDIQQIINDKYSDVDFESLSLEELQNIREEMEDLSHEYDMLQLAMKLLGNGLYGACASPFFYFYNVNLAGDITGECRNLTKTMWNNMEVFFHETIWNRKDLWERFDFALDESKHDWCRQQTISVYSDTDSVYVTYEPLFDCMTAEYQNKYSDKETRLKWMLKFNTEFMNGQNNQWCRDIYDPRHGKNVHEFELETVQISEIALKKKKYLKATVFNKGKFLLDHPKVSGTGIELIKSTTPKLARVILKDLMESLLFEYDVHNKDLYIEQFHQKLVNWKEKFYNAEYEEISQSVGIGDYKKFVIDDKDALIFAKGCPTSVHAIARYNYLAHKHGQDNLITYSGKIKYYNIRINLKQSGFFGFPAGELPEWRPPMDKLVQWQKNIIDPINRFLVVLDMPELKPDLVRQLSLFD